MALSVVVFDVGETLVDEATTYERWGVQKPDSDFFARVVHEAGVPAEQILYVGDRVDNDVVPALAAGLRVVRVRRGAQARLESPEGTVTIDSLVELPQVLDRV